MKVKDLGRMMAERNDHRVVVKLGDIEIAEDASTLSVGNGLSHQQFMLDDHALAALGKYLKIPKPYLAACPKEFRAETLTYWRDKYAEADTMLEVLDGELVAVYSPHLLMLPLREIVEVVERLFSPEADVHTFIRDQKTFHLDVTSPQYSSDAAPAVHGGLRVLAYPTQVKPPVIATYLHRGDVHGGIVTDLKDGQITLKGRTVDDVLAEIEIGATEILATLSEQLAIYAQTAEIAVPGSPQGFALALAREAGLPVKVREAVLDLVNQLPPDAAVYDVTGAFVATSLRGVNYSTRLKLEELSGRLAFDAHAAIARCGTCEQLLVAS
jgi:hypothetical protein